MNPVQRFALYGGLCIAGLSVVLGFASSLFLEEHMREEEWITTAEVVRFQVEEHQLASYLTDPARRQAPAGYRNAFQPLLSLPEVVRIKLWDREATVLWSDDDRLIGTRFPENWEVQQALAGRVAVTLKTLRKAEQEYQREQFTKLAEIYVPIRSKTSGEILGVIEVYKLPARLFATIHRMRLVIWGIAVSGGVLLYVVLLPIMRHAYRKQLELEASLREHARGLDAAVQEQTRCLTHLHALSQLVASSLDQEPVFDYIVRAATELIPDTVATLWVLDEGTGDFTRLASQGPRHPHLQTVTRIPRGEGLVGEAAATGRPIPVAEVAADPRFKNPEWARAEGLHTAIFLPLTREGQTRGVLSVLGRFERALTESELELLTTFANQAAIAIENARLYEAVRRHAADLEARVKERTAELEEALQVKAQFLANISHELRTPLNAVLGFSEILLGRSPGDLTPKQERYLQQIHHGGKRLLELVTDLLEMTEAQTGPAALRMDRLAVSDLFGEVLGPLTVAARAKRVELGTTLDPGLPTVVADRRKLAQILHHLVTNAIRYTPAGGRITVGARRMGTPEGEEAEIAVADTGIGIRAEDRERIFRGFEQVDASDSRQYGGAGLGLALVRRLVELHGGRVWAESEGEGLGARFIVRLPLLAAPPPRRVLVVEDEAHVLEALCTALAAAGYTVDRARTGSEALDRLATTPTSLLVLDLGLPEVDGWEVLKQVRGQERTRVLPVLVLTGQDHIAADQALALGANEFLTKPVSAHVLVETVARLLARPAGISTGAEEPPRVED